MERDLTQEAMDDLGLRRTDRHDLTKKANLENEGLAEFTPEQIAERQAQIQEQAAADQNYQDGYEGFDADGEAGKAKDGERGSSLGSSRERLKQIMSGNIDLGESLPVGMTNIGFREEKLEKLLEGKGFVLSDEAIDYGKQCDLRGDELEVAMQGAGFKKEEGDWIKC